MSETDTHYASVVYSGKTVSPTASFQSAVLSIMYKEKQMQEVRNRNFVIYIAYKTVLVRVTRNMLKTELNLKPVVNTCKRLGKIMPGKVRPVLVTVQSAEQASAVISSARSLRKSDNSYVKEHVHINPDLTKAQAAAAYQAHCQWQLARAAHKL